MRIEHLKAVLKGSWFVLFSFIFVVDVNAAVGDVYYCVVKHTYHVWEEGRVTKDEGDPEIFKLKRNKKSVIFRYSNGREVEFTIFEGRDPELYKPHSESFSARNWREVFDFDYHSFTHTKPAGGAGATVSVGSCEMF